MRIIRRQLAYACKALLPSMSLRSETPGLSGAAARVRLDSWKEIAAYLKRDMRTVQLWEKKEGLPVHRHTHTTRVSVYAYSDEIDAWRNRRRPQPDPALSLQAEAPIEIAQGLSAPPGPARRTPAIYFVVGMLVICVIATAGIRSYRHAKSRKKKDDEPVIAILPFDDLSVSRRQSYLADGLTEDLITDLGKSGCMQVISRSSISRFKGNLAALPEIAQELHANLVLEGTITYSAKLARITVQLVDATTGRQLWANSYERKFDNVLAFEDEIASEITQSVIQQISNGTSSDTISSVSGSKLRFAQPGTAVARQCATVPNAPA